MTWNKLQAYVNKTVSNNLWKVKALGYEFQDLKQEAWLIYHKCKINYKGDIDDRQFMSYFKISFQRLLYKLANEATELRECIYYSDDVDQVDEDAEYEIILNADLSLAPEPIDKFFKFIKNPPEEYFNSKKGGRGLNSNVVINKIIGCDHRVDSLKRIKDYIKR